MLIPVEMILEEKILEECKIIEVKILQVDIVPLYPPSKFFTSIILQL